ncbi:ARPP-1 family domain-containing protein [Bacillus bombysepticus]|uniref:ARPP-1 family domain-containing protein n=1 Tax=Bacillus bombysepticus TaxID=658666 RepID=UPI00301A4657
MNKLQGLQYGTPQTVGIMTVIPLIGEDVSTPLGSIEDIQFVGTSNYGTMEFTNSSKLPVIIPNGYTVLTKQSAQDHSLPFAVVSKPGFNRYTNACCVEQTQPGMIDGEKVKGFNLLPLSIRKEHFKQYIYGQKVNSYGVRSIEFSRLWDVISSFQSKLVGKHEAHLVYFFTKFVDELNRFNAEFEVVEKQRGAIIMLLDHVVGIEVLPSHKDWQAVWHKLIRDSYGSEIVRLTQLNLVKTFESKQQNTMDLSMCNSLEQIEAKLLEKEKQKIETASSQVSKIFNNKQLKHSHYETLKMEKEPIQGIQYSLTSCDDASYFFEEYHTNTEILYLSVLSNSIK